MMDKALDNSQALEKKKRGMRKKAKDLTVEDFYFLKIGNMWRYMKTQHFSFWMICCYIFFEYSRPQAIFPSIDILPWAQTFLLLSLIGAVLDPTVRWVKSPMNWLMILYAVLVYLSSIYAFDPEISKKFYIQFYSWFVVYFLIIAVVNTRERFYVFMLIILLSSAKIAFGTAKSWVMRGFGFTSWGLKGPPGYFENSGELAILMLTLFPIAFYLYEYLKDKVSTLEKYLLMLMWITPIMTILGASSRGAQLALVVQLVIMFYKKIFRFRQLVLIGLMGFALFHLLPDEQKQRFQEAGEDKTSIQRLLYWEHGMEMIRDNPFLGVGFFNFPKYYENYYGYDLLYHEAQLPHNILIQVGVDAGVVAVSLFVAMMIYSILLARKLINKAGVSYCSAIGHGLALWIIGYFVAGQFVSVAYYPFVWIGLSLLVACESIRRKQGAFKADAGNKLSENAMAS